MFQAGPLTANAVQVTKTVGANGTIFVIKDDGAGATIEIGTGCDPGKGAGVVVCGDSVVGPGPEVLRLRAILGDGNDSFLLTGSGPPMPGLPANPVLTPAKINGGPGNDRITAADGADLIVGGPGINTARGAGGNDRLAMRNGKRDTLIDCGAGIDTAVVDRIDPVPIACETVLKPRT